MVDGGLLLYVFYSMILFADKCVMNTESHHENMPT